MSVIEGPFASYLEQHRARCNARFARLGGRVRSDLAYSVIRDIVAPLAQEVPSSQITAVSHCLIDSAFSLLRSGLIGPESRSVLINHLWMEGFPKLVPFMLEDSNRLVSAMTNAVFRIEQISEQAARQWLTQLLSLSVQCVDLDELLKLGQVLAWTNGQSGYRESAIEVWKQLSPELQYATLGTETPHWDNPWSHPSIRPDGEGKLQLVGRIGGHVDLGGIFQDPPMVGTVNGTILAFDSGHYFTVYGDCFGVQSRPFIDEPDLDSHTLPAAISVTKNGTVNWGSAQLDCPQFAQPSSVAFANHALYVTVDHSFFVSIFARVAQ